MVILLAKNAEARFMSYTMIAGAVVFSSEVLC